MFLTMQPWVQLETKVHEDFTITEKAIHTCLLLIESVYFHVQESTLHSIDVKLRRWHKDHN